MALSHLSTEELVRHVLSMDNPTDTEAELLARLEVCVDMLQEHDEWERDRSTAADRFIALVDELIEAVEDGSADVMDMLDNLRSEALDFVA